MLSMTSKQLRRWIYLPLGLLLTVALEGAETTSALHHTDVVEFLLGLAVILVAAKLGAEVVERMGQPSVLGELLVGVVLGNLVLLGIPYFEPLKQSAGLKLAAEIGVILLLFEVGIESEIRHLLKVGLSSFLVAMIGVIGPTLLGYWVSYLFYPGHAWYVHLFVGATLAATSVGITARVLQDINKLNTTEARIILGAAVVDDVLGLILLAVVSGLVANIAAGGTGEFEVGPVAVIVVKAFIFLAAAIVIGGRLHLRAVSWGEKFRVPGIPLIIAVTHCFALSALAGWIGLAPIVGAFAAGLVLEEKQYDAYRQRGEAPIGQLIHPLTTIFSPVFFVMMGLAVDLRAFTSLEVVEFAAIVTVAAIVGKQACSLGVLEKGVNRIVVGVGMIPRGEVGLIFTGIGATLAVKGEPVFSSELVSAMVVMVMVTTLVTPPFVKYFFEHRRGKAASSN